jgi:hypothetical protein
MKHPTSLEEVLWGQVWVASTAAVRGCGMVATPALQFQITQLSAMSARPEARRGHRCIGGT